MIFCCVLSQLQSLEIRQISPLHSPRPGDVIEWEITVNDATWLNASTQQTPFMTFHEQGREKVVRPAFVYQPFRTDPRQTQGEYRATGKKTLRIRHSTHSVGKLKWQLFAPQSNVATTTPLAADSLAIVAGTGSAGAIRQAPFNKRLLATADGEPFIPVGPNIAWALGKDRLAQFITYLDKLSAVGGNHIRIWCASWFGQIEDPQNR